MKNRQNNVCAVIILPWIIFEPEELREFTCLTINKLSIHCHKDTRTGPSHYIFNKI